jgi:hypothetical protein
MPHDMEDNTQSTSAVANRISVTKIGMGWCITLPGRGQPCASIANDVFDDGIRVFYVKCFSERGELEDVRTYPGLIAAMAYAQEWLEHFQAMVQPTQL